MKASVASVPDRADEPTPAPRPVSVKPDVNETTDVADDAEADAELETADLDQELADVDMIDAALLDPALEAESDTDADPAIDPAIEAEIEADEVEEIAASGEPVAEEEDDEEEEQEPVRRPMPASGHRSGMHGMMHNGRPAQISRASNKDENFAEGDYVVYPTHGVGKVEKIATEDIAGHRLELIHITFEENRMTLRVPVAKARSAGLRKLATRKLFDEALAVLKGRARVKRTMWSRRAQEYEAKINSGDPLSIAEVVRDLHRNAGQPDQSFSERQIYEAAMDRLAAELGALDQTDKMTAVTKLGNFLKTV